MGNWSCEKITVHRYDNYYMVKQLRWETIFDSIASIINVIMCST